MSYPDHDLGWFIASFHPTYRSEKTNMLDAFADFLEQTGVTSLGEVCSAYPVGVRITSDNEYWFRTDVALKALGLWQA